MAYTKGTDEGAKGRWTELSLRGSGRFGFGWRYKAAAVALIALAMAAVLLGGRTVSASDGIKRGVEVGGVEVGGMSQEEARQALQGKAGSELEVVRFGSGEQAVSGERLGVSLDAEKSVRQAWAVGRDGWFGERAFDSLRGSSSGVEIPAAVSYDEAAARQAVSGFAPEVRQEPEDASYEISGDEVEVVGGESGRELNTEQTLANLGESLENLEGQVPLATESVEPEETVEELEGMAPTEKLGEYQTDYNYSDSEARKDNLEMSSEAVNGTVLSPGETFSMNDHLVGLDYKKAKVFSEGGESVADGGGLCQVTSTVYMAAQYAGLEIVERNPHYTVLPYIRPGFDATIWFGGQGIPELDMKFKNTTDSNILIREYIDDEGFLTAEIYGQPTGKEVEMRSERDFRDTDRGIQWSTYKTVKEDGETVSEGKLREDLYSFPPPEATEEGYNDVRVGGW